MGFLTITDNAIKEIKAVVQQQKYNLNDIYVLVGVKITHSGFSYNFHIVESIVENLAIQIVDDIKFVLNEKFAYLFDELKLDYILEPAKFGFVFIGNNIVENIE